MSETFARLWRSAREPVDGASLAVFRIALGSLIAFDAIRKGARMFGSNEGALFRFAYGGFEWVPSAGAAAPWLAHIWLASAICVVLGLFYRPAMILTTALTIFGFLQAEEYYLNHYYLLIIVCILMCFVPANRAFALDRFWTRSRAQAPVVARMHMWFLKGQTEIVLVYAGLVKLNSDWLQLEPLRSWLLKRQDNVFFGAIWQYDWAIAAGNYGIIALHVLGAPLLLWKRTRLPIFLVYCSFHATNHFLFDIGIFPWMTIAMSALFFAPDWPRRFIPLTAGSQQLWVPIAANRNAAAFAVFASVWLVSQAVLPLRHYTYAGDVAWTYEGHRFAWRMKLVDRWSPGMLAVAYVPERNLMMVPPLNHLLTDRQRRKVSTRPRMAQKMAPQLAAMIAKAYGVRDVRVHLYYPVGYNNREAALLIDPAVNLVTAPTRLRPAPWIIKDNDKPLRRIEAFSSKFNYPNLRQIAKMMKLPIPVGCKTMNNRWILCHGARARHLSLIK